MRYFGLNPTWAAICALSVTSFAAAAEPFTLATMPRVDAHAHISPAWEVIDEYMELRAAMKEQLNVEMAMWIGLKGYKDEMPDLKELRTRYQGRILWVLRDRNIEDGMDFSPLELVEWQERGVEGFKFYPGWQPGIRIDHPANDPVFSKMEQIGMVAAAVHVGNPCGIFGQRTSGWIPDPVVFWQHQRAWENVLIQTS